MGWAILTIILANVTNKCFGMSGDQDWKLKYSLFPLIIEEDALARIKL